MDDLIIDFLIRLNNAKTEKERKNILSEIDGFSYEWKVKLSQMVKEELKRRENLN